MKYRDVCAQLEALGLRLRSESKQGRVYISEDGWIARVNYAITEHDARYVIHNTQKHLGVTTVKDGKKRKASQVKEREAAQRARFANLPVSDERYTTATFTATPPAIDMTKLYLTTHAVERFQLMQGQNPDVTGDELWAALADPRRVEFRGDNWVWYGPRLGLAIVFTTTGRAIVRSVLWASKSTYQKHPRPEYDPANGDTE